MEKDQVSMSEGLVYLRQILNRLKFLGDLEKVIGAPAGSQQVLKESNERLEKIKLEVDSILKQRRDAFDHVKRLQVEIEDLSKKKATLESENSKLDAINQTVKERQAVADDLTQKIDVLRKKFKQLSEI
jgi:uncharacterized protein YoxC